jgi:hypothetical protein
LNVAAKILLRCWIFGFLLLMVWIGMFMLASQVIYGLHGGMFGLSPHDLNVIHYSGTAFLKLVVICFFFFPWLAIRLVSTRPGISWWNRRKGS